MGYNLGYQLLTNLAKRPMQVFWLDGRANVIFPKSQPPDIPNLEAQRPGVSCFGGSPKWVVSLVTNLCVVFRGPKQIGGSGISSPSRTYVRHRRDPGLAHGRHWRCSETQRVESQPTLAHCFCWEVRVCFYLLGFSSFLVSKGIYHNWTYFFPGGSGKWNSSF